MRDSKVVERIISTKRAAQEYAVYGSRNAARGDIREMVMDFKEMRNNIYKLKHILEEEGNGK